MKKYIATFLTFAIMAIALPLTADAQTSRRYKKDRTYRTYQHDNRSTYRKNRNLINIGIGAGAGAIAGGILGGKKGALIGAGVGAGAGAAYTYGIKPKKRRY